MSAPIRRFAPAAALLLGNGALALGPLFVRLADTGPVAAGFWRLALALPALWLLALREGGAAGLWPALTVRRAAIGAGLFFAADLASWHIGIARTRLGNAALFGNCGSILIMGFGLLTAGRAPLRREWLALGAALAGGALLLGRSLQIDARTLAGDLFCILAGVLYTFYILLLQRARARIGNWVLLAWASLAATPMLLAIAMGLGERIWPQVWWPVAALALSSQLIGQGLLVYALRHFPPLVIGMALLTQPAVAALAGWLRFGEVLGPGDLAGMALVAGALVLARARQPAVVAQAVPAAPDGGTGLAGGG